MIKPKCTCQKVFCTVNGFGPKGIQIMRRKIESRDLEDGCGKHDNHPAVYSEINILVQDHIKSLPSRQNHYSSKDNSDHTYLSPNLSIARLNHKFLERHDRIQSQRRRIQLQKPVIFVNEFNIHSGYPRTDT